jgi:hypothetical protein
MAGKADGSAVEPYQVVAVISGMLWAGRGPLMEPPAREELDRMSDLAWDVYYSAVRTSGLAAGRYRDGA